MAIDEEGHLLYRAVFNTQQRRPEKPWVSGAKKARKRNKGSPRDIFKTLTGEKDRYLFPG